MQINPKVKRQLVFQHWLFIVLFVVCVGLLGWLSTRYVYEADWTQNQRNTPSDTTLTLLGNVPEMLSITAFVGESNQAARKEIERLVKQYQRFKSNIELTFVDPATEPDLVREKNISKDGELLLELAGRTENIQVINEQALTNAIQRLARQGERWVVFLEGHDERNPLGDNSYDLGSFAKQLQTKGFKIQNVNLASTPAIPDNTAVLVISDPQKDLLNGEITLVQDYIDQGGNVLWLTEPGPSKAIDVIGEQLGIEFLPGVVVDMNTQLLGLSDPRFTIVPDYSQHPVTRGLSTLTLFPAARAMEFNGLEEWDSEIILETLPRTWAETDELGGEISLDPAQDVAGPLVIGMALTRISPKTGEAETLVEETLAEESALQESEAVSSQEKQQRLIVVGDADFISDAYLGQGGNLDLGMNIINWLALDDTFIAIPSRIAIDRQLELTTIDQAVIGFSFLLVIPAGLLGAGFFIWWKRRKA